MLCAGALSYTVALSIVPIVALAFSALKGFGGYGRSRFTTPLLLTGAS